MITIVRKRFEADGKLLLPGQVVDSSAWRNERLLVEHRYLQPAGPVLPPSVRLANPEAGEAGVVKPSVQETPAEAKAELAVPTTALTTKPISPATAALHKPAAAIPKALPPKVAKTVALLNKR